MRPAVWAMLLVLLLVGGSQAQDARQPSDWKKMYQDVEGQLHAAQDRKSEMAKEAAQLQKQLHDAREQILALTVEVDALRSETLFMGDVYADWESFAVLRPSERDQWRAFWGDRLPGFFDGFPFVIDRKWPFSVP